ncbi:MAG: cysteine desulfurase [Clostridiales bacterium]|nr:cysteine desulfurase [Clostridiales bacterium]
MKPIYFDHAATTPLDKRVLETMMPYFTDIFGNANSQHMFGREAIKGVDTARDTIAKLINCKPSEIYFTSGGTEADNWVLKGVADAYKEKGKHIIITKIEHAAMLETARALEKKGFEVSYASPTTDGIITPEEIESLIRPDTILIGCMFANNEIGTIQPIKEIVEVAKKHKILTFTDAVQAAGVIKLDVKELGVDFMSFSAHKFYGPKGIGALYVKNGVKIATMMTGGHQERTKRGGTTNVPAVIGFAKAFELANEELEENAKYVTMLRDRFIDGILKEVPFVRLNGHRTKRLPANADFSFEYIEGESILFSLDLAGIAVSSGSACSSGSLDPSHVLLAIGVPVEIAHGSIRFTFGKHNTIEEVDYAIKSVKEIVERLRALSPLFNAKDGEIKNV